MDSKEPIPKHPNQPSEKGLESRPYNSDMNRTRRNSAMHRSSMLPTRSGRYVAAMVLGTALSALGAAPGQAAPSRDFESRAVQDLTRYCTTCWRNARLDPNQWQDATQDVFCRLLERVEPAAWGSLLKEEN